MLEFKLVNDEVAPLDEMNFLGLLCKVRGGQGERFTPDPPRDKGLLMGIGRSWRFFAAPTAARPWRSA